MSKKVLLNIPESEGGFLKSEPEPEEIIDDIDDTELDTINDMAL